MRLRFDQGRVTLVVCPVDMRCGYQRLSTIAAESSVVEHHADRA